MLFSSFLICIILLIVLERFINSQIITLFVAISLVLVYVIFTSDGLHRFLFGCARKFDNGRKCRVWDCPNKLDCPFYDRKADKNE